MSSGNPLGIGDSHQIPVFGMTQLNIPKNVGFLSASDSHISLECDFLYDRLSMLHAQLVQIH